MWSSGKKILTIAWASLAYAGFLTVALWAIVFLADTGVATTVDGGPGGPVAAAILADLGLLLLFAAQHSVMARRAWKERLARRLPPAAERATNV
ncbi:MAG TPA: hypothetical protein VF843_16860, partial [Streptosporangiaceae bacterium]